MLYDKRKLSFSFAGQMRKTMTISAEISCYPLKEDFLGPIQNFIDRLQAYEELFVRPNGMSTHVIGDYDKVMEVLNKEMKTSFENPYSVFALKILNGDMREVE